jgi:glycosyltransferase involved in cell wall biosynthesis
MSSVVSSEVNVILRPADANLRGACGILIPAYNEAATVATVITVALASGLGPVLVVDDGSDDGTTEQALATGATVLTLTTNQGKGGAVFAGAETLKTEVIVLIDADLINLKPEHLQALAEPVMRGEADVTRGVFTEGRWHTTAAQNLTPQLNGQRAIRRDNLLKLSEMKESGYGMEIVIANAVKRNQWHLEDVAMAGVSQVVKEEKRGFWQGLSFRMKMYGEVLETMVKSTVRRGKR